MLCVINIPLTINSDLAITIIVSCTQEGFGFFVSQNTSPRREPLKEEPDTHTHNILRLHGNNNLSAHTANRLISSPKGLITSE